MQKDHFPSTHELRLTGSALETIVRDGPPPRLPQLPQRTTFGRQITQAEVDAGDVFWRGAAYRFELLSGEHSLTGGELEYGWRVETFSPSTFSKDQLVWSLRDHPQLALRVAELVDDATGRVETSKMLAFLEQWGPLGWSVLIGSFERDPDVLLGSTELARYVGDPREGAWAFEFSRPAKLVKDTLLALNESPEEALTQCLISLDQTAQHTLLRGLLLQVLRLAVAGSRPRLCEGCACLFVHTETPSAAVHRQAWKRTDARYHSARCRRAHLERERRRRRRAAKHP